MNIGVRCTEIIHIIPDIAIAASQLLTIKIKYKKVKECHDIIKNPGVQPEIFEGRGGFVKLGHFDKHFIKKSRKKATQEKFLEFFLLDTLKTTF